MVSNSLTIQDVLRMCCGKKPSKKIEMDIFFPIIIIPVLLLISCTSLIMTIITMVAIAMGVLYVCSRPRQKNRSQFFYSWTISSGIYMFLIFQYEILMLLEITQLENLILIILILCTFYSFYKVKSIADFELAMGSSKGKEYNPVLTADSHYCQICQIEVNNRYFHSIWWDCCIFCPNYPHFIIGLFCAEFSLIYGAYLGLTTICHPNYYYGILVPENCNLVYYTFDTSISFVTCVYALCYVLAITFVIAKQLCVFVPRYYGLQWKKFDGYRQLATI